MSNLICWEPMSEIVTLREAMDRLFNVSFFPSRSRLDRWSGPAIDLYQTDDEVVVKASLPGMKVDDIQISVTSEMITIKGEPKEINEVKEKSYHLREQRSGAFERSVALPTAVLSDNAKAEFQNGMLTVTLPKAEEVKARLITVNSK